MAKITHYDIGDVWQPQFSFTVAGVATDPTTVTVKVKNPAGTITTMGPVSGATGGSGITRTGVGVYKIVQQLDVQGYWFARGEGTGTATAAEDQEAIADPSEFYSSLNSRALVGLAETKAWLEQRNIDTSNDLELTRVINDISDRFQQEAAREIMPSGTNPATRTFQAPVGGRRDPWYIDFQYMGDRATWRRTVPVGDLTSFTQVQIIDTDWTTVLETVALSKVTALPFVRQAWEPIRALQFNSTVTMLSEDMRVSVLGTWGFPSVPGTVRQAVMEAVAAVMDRDVEHYRQDLATPAQNEGGNVIVVGSTGTSRLLSLPPSAMAVAWSLRDSWLA